MTSTLQKTAFLFPGQGSQSVGMMAAYEPAADILKGTFAEASEVLGYDLLDVVANGPEERLNQTEVTQPAVLTAGIAVWRLWLKHNGPVPDFVAGHSLGEYTALVVSGVLQFEDAVALVAERGRSMQAATPPGSGGMAAILGLDDDVLSEVCDRAAKEGPIGAVVSCANFNSPGQIVIAGSKAAVGRACELASEAGARRAIPLAVSVPSHCALMKPAADHMTAVLHDVRLNTPEIPLLHNWNVTSHSGPEEIRTALIKQLTCPVKWTNTIRVLIDSGVGRFVECGPG
jgi:[acyl-carrier-protein] S-malonyltransferase